MTSESVGMTVNCRHVRRHNHSSVAYICRRTPALVFAELFLYRFRQSNGEYDIHRLFVINAIRLSVWHTGVVAVLHSLSTHV